MKENVCITCEYYEKCNKPEREIKCMGYKEKDDEQNRKDYKFNQLDFFIWILLSMCDILAHNMTDYKYASWNAIEIFYRLAIK